MAFTFADSAASLAGQVPGWDEAVDPGQIVIALDEQTSDQLAASVVTKAVSMTQNRQGQTSRVQPCLVHVRKALLPEWATAESLPGEGKVTTGGKTFKISTAADHGLTLYLECLRWPDDEE